MKSLEKKIILTGGAGLVGQNLLIRLKARGWRNITIIDKHAANIGVLRSIHSDVTVLEADLSTSGDWTKAFFGAHAVVMLQAQIGGLDEKQFIKNNVTSTKLIIDAMRSASVSELVHISSSVVNSSADDFYTRSKIAQERIIIQSGYDVHILRPTLMFGWFDRKHLGWLARFMAKVPFFPIPGHGRYMRQPLYVGDLCEIIISILTHDGPTGTYNITGRERINYIDLIKEVRRASAQKTTIVKIPFHVFKTLLAIWAIFDKTPPFTTQQLDALVTKDEFEVIDWPQIFGVKATPLGEAMDETFCHHSYSKIVLEF